MKDAPSPNHQPRPPGQAVDMVVLHYTGMAGGPAALARLRDPAAEVSAHYMVEENGDVLRLVAEDRRAWHAGVSCWRGMDDINSRSIGIELVNPGHEFGYRPFPEAQMTALETLLADILTRHAVPPHHLLAHSDIAPGRKCDPGELFDWARLAEAGFGLWPGSARDGQAAAQPTDEATFLAKLAAYGYPAPCGYPAPGGNGPTAAQAITAFERRFRPWKLSGAADAENQGRLDWLLERVAPS